MSLEIHIHNYPKPESLPVLDHDLAHFTPDVYPPAESAAESAPKTAFFDDGGTDPEVKTFEVKAFPAAGRLLRKKLVAAVARAAVADGGGDIDVSAVERAIDYALAERPILDWLANGGFEKLVRLVAELVKLLG